MGQDKGKIPAGQAEALRSLPSVEELLETRALTDTTARFGRPLMVESARRALEGVRQRILASEKVSGSELSLDQLAADAIKAAEESGLPSLRPVINATGVVVHTNLGRSLLADEAIAAVERVSSSYSNLEYDLAGGERGSRHEHITGLIRELTGAEDALVVNNNAAAVLMALMVFASGREVIVSRGELVEIGGSFRIPDVMAASTARLVEVGTTNKTKLSDYEAAIGPDTAMLLHVHTSNYQVVGFTAEVPVAELAELGRERELMVVDDLGSGVLADLPAFAGEPSVRDSLKAGADLVTFSGDKLLGGPQAGIIAGKAKAVRRLRSHPLARALRVDKMTLAALQATLALYLNPETAVARIPTLRMLSESGEEIAGRAEALMAAVAAACGDTARVEIEPAKSKVGGGALPLLELDSFACAVYPASLPVDDLAARLRQTDPPVIGRIHKERLLLDARTVLAGQVEAAGEAFRQAMR